MVTECNNGGMRLPISEVVIHSVTPPTQQDGTNTINTMPMPLPTNDQIDSTTLSIRQLTSSSNVDDVTINFTPPPINLTPNTSEKIKGVIELYHDTDKKYVIDHYCKPLSHSFKNPNEVCHHSKKNCIVLKSKVISKGKQQSHLSNTTFGSIPWPTGGNHQYKQLDTRVISCLNPTCKSPITKQQKTFHYCCYMHMMATRKDEMPDHLTISNNDDRLIEFVEDSVSMASICENIMKTNITKLIIPVCGKRCYSKLLNHQSKVKKNLDSEYATAASWENDGDEINLSSIQVLINWLTTEENCSKYFGGIDVNGRTSANRKETYHHRIRDMIKDENGE